MTIGPARYKTLSLDEDLDGIDDIPTTCVQDCILLAFKRLQEQHHNIGEAIGLCEPALDQFAESIDLLFTHRLKNKRNSFWNVAKEISCRDVIDTLTNLPLVCTSIGRARAWIYQALQDGLLTCYMAQIEKDVKLLSRFYKPNAAIRDLDFMFAVNNLLSGLDAITFNINIDCSSFDSGQAPSSVKKTLFGNVVDDLSLSTAADAIALQIPQIFKKFSSNSSINGSRSSLNTIDSNDSSQPSVDTADTVSIASFCEPPRKNHSQRMRKKPLKQKRSPVDRGLSAQGRSIASEKAVSTLSDVRETLSEAPPVFGTLIENKTDDVLMLMASKLREQAANDHTNISDISVRRILERDADVSNSPKVEDFLNFGPPSLAPEREELTASGKRRSTVVESRTNQNSNSGSIIDEGIQHRSSNPEYHSRPNQQQISIECSSNVASDLASKTHNSDHSVDGSYEEKNEQRFHKSGSNSSKTSNSHSFDNKSQSPGNSDVIRTSSFISIEGEKLRDRSESGGAPTWEFSASFMSKFDQIVEQPGGQEYGNDEELELSSNNGAKLDTLRRQSVKEIVNNNENGVHYSSEKGDVIYQDCSSQMNSFDTSQTGSAFHQLTSGDSGDVSSVQRHGDESSSIDDVIRKEFSSSGSDEKYRPVAASTFREVEEDENEQVAEVQQEDIDHIAAALSPTVYLDQNPVAFNKCDIFIDHMTQLTFELKVYQFNNDGDEQAIKLYRGFYRHMEMPKTWSHKSYHARPIDLLVTNKALYILKFNNDKATSLHYFFPLDEITLISVYPFGQGLKIYSRRSRKTDWAKVSVNESRRTSEFWFETGDETFTQTIVEKLHQVMTLHVESCNLPSFGDLALMETVQLRKLMALTFNYEDHNDADIQRFFLLHMGECPFLSFTHERERSVSCMRADSISADPSCLEGMLWLKQETSALGSIVKKSSHGIASLPTFAMHSSARHRQEAPIWKDYHFSIKQGVIYRAEYSENGRMGKSEPFITLSDCQSCAAYKDEEKLHAFSVSVSRSSTLAGLFQSRVAKSRIDATFYFAAKSEREQQNWMNAVNDVNSLSLTTPGEKKQKTKSVPVKACAMVMDKKNAVICRYERDTDEFLVMEKFAFTDVERLIVPDKTQTPAFCILDFKITEQQENEEDDFEIVENTALVDNLLPICLYFCAPEECSNFISLLLKNEPSITSVPYSESGSETDVYKQLLRTEVENLKCRKIYKL